MEYEELLVSLTQSLISYAPQILAALVVLVLGWFVINTLIIFLRRRFTKAEFDASLSGFLLSFTNLLLKAVLIIIFVSMLGVQTTSLIALLGAAGLAVGLALQGSLSNFAGGVLILARKPFKVGEFISATGVMGTVELIDILYTTLKTPDGQAVIVPNGKLSNSEITNFSRKGTRRINLEVGISYSSNIDTAKKILKKIVESDKRVLPEPEPTYAVIELGDSSVVLRARCWVNNSDYWSTLFDFTEKTKKSFDKGGVSIPFPQRDVHLYKK
ncbi:MAG: mechanosensitive ion channel family protein [Candidatus Woesearchaeota archaeon]